MMNSRGRIALGVARSLESVPWLRTGLAKAYHRARYLIHRDPGAPARVAPGVTMTDVATRLPAAYQSTACFFGYYDKTPWGRDNATLLAHAQHSASELAICVVAPDGSRVIGTTSTWNVQQGAMLQWVPETHTIVWNDRLGDQLGMRLASANGEQLGELPYPIQAVSPSGRHAVSLNYTRLRKTRPEYGYSGRYSNMSPDMPLDRDGLWQIELCSGEVRHLVSLESIRTTEPRPEMEGATHYLNHVMYSPDGGTMVFLHRWVGKSGLFTRLYASDADGGNRRLLRDERLASHCTWIDNDTLLVWARTPKPDVRDCYQVIDVRSGEWKPLTPEALNQLGDGHPTYSPDGRFLLTDTYPDAARRRRLVIHRVGTEQVTVVGDFLAPWKFDGEIRCDLHPRWNRDGTRIAVDSAHTGIRRFYELDVGQLVG